VKVSELTSVRDTVEDLSRRLGVAEATLSIQRLKADYSQLVDSRLALGEVVAPQVLATVVSSIVELFTEDAVWDGGPVLGKAVGREEIAARLSKPTLTFSRHLFVKPRISVDLPNASATWDLLCPCNTPDGRSWWMCGYEDDDYRLESGVWRHSKMTLTTVFMSPVGEPFERIFV
jgi:SnoaL-like domain